MTGSGITFSGTITARGYTLSLGFLGEGGSIAGASGSGPSWLMESKSVSESISFISLLTGMGLYGRRFIFIVGIGATDLRFLGEGIFIFLCSLGPGPGPSTVSRLTTCLTASPFCLQQYANNTHKIRRITVMIRHTISTSSLSIFILISLLFSVIVLFSDKFLIFVPEISVSSS